MEEWRTIPSFPEYEVSDLGKIRRAAAGRGARVGRLLAQTPLPAGYKLVSLHRRPNKVITLLVHRLVAEAFIGPCPEGQEVSHEDDDKANNHASNLLYRSRADNLAHTPASHRGAHNGASRIGERDVLAIRTLQAEGLGYIRIAQRLGISWSIVRGVLTGRTWTHV